jgi:DNA-binding LacI/PurR family transcriptional regulator
MATSLSDVARGSLSVAGVDDSRYSQVRDLTTVRLPVDEFGALGARYVLGLDGAPFSTGTYLSHRIVPRGTTTWAARAASRQVLRPAGEKVRDAAGG